MSIHYVTNRVLLARLALLLLLAALVPTYLQAQTLSWQSAITAGPTTGSSYTVARIALDAAENVYVVGSFSGTVAFGSATLVSAGGTDGFVAKWSPTTQQFIGATAMGGPQNEVLRTLAVQGTSLYVGGTLDGTATIGNTLLTSAGSTDGLVIKLTDTGTSISPVWAQRLGGTQPDYVSGIAASGTGVFVTGGFMGTIAVGSTTFSSAGDADIFVVKLLDGGAASSVAWAQHGGGTGKDQANDLAVSGTSVYVVGLFYGTLQLGSLSLLNAGIYDGFVAKLTDAGSSASFVWVRQVGFFFLDEVRAVVAQGANVYITGFFDTYVKLDKTELYAVDLTDVFVAKLYDAGTQAAFVWAAQGGALQDDFANTLLVQGTQVYVGGGVTNNAVFGLTTVTGNGYYNFFVAQLTDLGNSYVWNGANGAGGAGANFANSLAVAANGVVYAGGTAAAPASFGSYPLPSGLTGLTGVVARLAPSTPTSAGPQAARAAIGLYPVPAHSTVMVQLPAGLAASAATLTVLDAVGRAVRTRTAAVAAGTAQATLDVAGLAPGVYALRVAAGESLSTARLVVE